MEKLPQIIDAVAMIGMVMRPDHRIDVGHVCVEQLFAQIGAGIDEDAGSAAFDQHRSAATAVARLGRIACPPIIADPRHPG